MDHKTLWTDFAKYNLWANRQFATLFSSLGEGAANKAIVSSFPSVKLTLLHIWDAEMIWLDRLQDKRRKGFPSENFNGSINEVINGWLACSQRFCDFLEQSSASFFEERKRFNTFDGTAWTQTAWQMIQHCLNHSTFHRGQLVVMARQLGLDKIPSTDIIYYLRNNP